MLVNCMYRGERSDEEGLLVSARSIGVGDLVISQENSKDE